MKEVQQDLMALENEIVKVFGWHSALKFDSTKMGAKGLVLSAPRLTNEYDSDLDASILEMTLGHYEENFESLDLNDYAFSIELISSEMGFCIKVFY